MAIIQVEQRLLEIVGRHGNCSGEAVSSDLTPLLGLFARIPVASEFTHLPPLFDASENFPITDMYVELRVAHMRSLAHPVLLKQGKTIADEQEERYKQHVSRHISIHQCVSIPQHHRIVILGDPGSGKTSLMKYLCLEIATGKSERWLVPLFVPLRRYWLAKQQDASLTLLRYVVVTLLQEGECQHTQAQLEVVESLLRTLSGAEKVHVLFLLDGLDEIATNTQALEAVSADIRQLGKRFSWVLTSRHTGFFGDVGEDICYEVVRLGKAGIEELVGNWFANSHPGHQASEQQLLLSQIDTNPRLRDMAGNPFLLTLLCHIQRQFSNRCLPLHRSDVYANIIYLIRLQLRHVKKDSHLFREAEMAFLARFCHYLYTAADNAPLQIFEYTHWDQFALPDTPPDFDQHFLSSRLINSWRQGGDFHFTHLTFQEYLIAVHLTVQPFAQVSQHLFNPHWKMVYRFLAGIYSKQADQQNLKALLEAVTAPVDQMGILYLEAARFLVEANIEDSTRLLGYDLRERLWQLWTNSADYVRESAGEVLALLSPGYVLAKLVGLQQACGQEPSSRDQYVLLRSIRLLGLIYSAEADELIMDFLQTDQEGLQAMAIGAIAVKNMHSLRQGVIGLYETDRERYFPLLCNVAKVTRHKAFTDCLRPYLQHKPADMEKYDLLFQALTALGDVTVTDALLQFAESCSATELSYDLLEALLSLHTQASMKWLEKMLQRADGELRKTVIFHAIRYGLLDSATLVRILVGSEPHYQDVYLTALLEQVQNGGRLEPMVIQTLLAMAGEDSGHSIGALSVLEQAGAETLMDGQALRQLKTLCRRYIDHADAELVVNSIAILSRFRDIQAYPKIRRLAMSANVHGVQSIAIQALWHYADLYGQEVRELLHTLYLDTHTSRMVADDALTVLAKMDVQAIFRYLDNPDTRDAITAFCAREGVLLFGDSYIDNFGIRHVFHTPQPKLDAAIPAEEQLEQLRQACLYALENNLVQKTAANRDSPLPALFVKPEPGINENRFPDGVHVKTGNKLLQGEKISAVSAQKILNRLKKVSHELFCH